MKHSTLSLRTLLLYATLSMLPTLTWAQQNDPDNDGELNPTQSAPAFGAKIDYSDSRFLATNLVRSDYASYPQVTNLPTIYITVDDVNWNNNSYVYKTDDYYEAHITVVDKSGQMKQRDELVQLRGRGNSTWRLSQKKPWRLKFPSKTKLLASYDLAKGKEVNDYANAKSWTLISNNFDRSLIRNGLTGEMVKYVNSKSTREGGAIPFVPACQYVDLVIQGEYWGTYQISDQVQVATKRVDIDKEGWFMEYVNNENGLVEQPCFVVDGKIVVDVKAPESDYTFDEDPNFDGTFYGPYTDEPKYDEMKAVAHAFHRDIMRNKNGYTCSNWQQYLDMENFIDWFLAMDIAANWDGCYANDYLYKNSFDAELKAGPVWDLDLGYGNYGYMSTQHHFWEQEKGIYQSIRSMLNDPYFVKQLVERWRVIKGGNELQQMMLDKADQLATYIKDSRELNYSKASSSARYDWERTGWDITTIRGIDAHGYANYEAALTALKTFISGHIPAIDSYYEDLYTTLQCSTLSGEPIISDELPEEEEPEESGDDNTGSDDNTGNDNGGNDNGGNTGSGEIVLGSPVQLTMNTTHSGMTLSISGDLVDANATRVEITVSGVDWSNLVKVNRPSEEWGTTVASDGRKYSLEGELLGWLKSSLLRFQSHAVAQLVITSYGPAPVVEPEEPEQPEEPSVDPEEPEQPEEPSVDPEEPEQPEEPAEEQPAQDVVSTVNMNTTHSGMTLSISGDLFPAATTSADIEVSGVYWSNILKVNNPNQQWGTIMASSPSHYSLSGEQLEWAKASLLRFQSHQPATLTITCHVAGGSSNGGTDSGSTDSGSTSGDGALVQVGQTQQQTLALSGSGDRKLIPNSLFVKDADRIEIRVADVSWANILCHSWSWDERYKYSSSRNEGGSVYFDVDKGTTLYNELVNNNGYLQSTGRCTIYVTSYRKSGAVSANAQHTYSNASYMLNGIGTYSVTQICTHCGEKHVAAEKYYKFTIYNANGTVKHQELTTDANWGAKQWSQLNPNQLIFTDAPGLTGRNVVSNNVCDELVLTDDEPYYSPRNFYARSATYTRRVSGDWGTLILPFRITDNDDVKLYQLSQVETAAGEGRLTLRQTTAVGAMEAVIFHRQTDATQITFTALAKKGSDLISVKAYKDYRKLRADEVDGWSHRGNVGSAVTLEADQQHNLYLFTGDQLNLTTGSLTVRPFSTYFVAPEGTDGHYRIVTSDINGIESIIGDELFELSIYDINGQLLLQTRQTTDLQSLGLQPGIYIVNGQKTVVK